MFANTNLQVGLAQRVVATLVACAVVLFTIGVYNIAQAASLEQISDTLSTSNPGVLSAHTIAFTVPTGGSIAPGNTITITFPAGFTVGTANGNTTVTVGGGGTTPTVGSSGQNVTVTNITASAGQEVIVAINNTVITNPGVGSYRISINTGNGDTGNTNVAIVNTVEVTAIVETQFTFVVDGTATSTSVNTGDTTTGSTTPIAINFGKLTANVPKILGQELAVTTNAKNGFTVTVESDSELISANGADIDNFIDSTDISTAGTPWSSPTPDIDDENTWGFWGMTSNDSDLANDLNAADSYIAVSSTTPREIFSHDGPSDGTTQDKGLAIVGYQIEISALQEAADDYNTTLTYIATPTF